MQEERISLGIIIARDFSKEKVRTGGAKVQFLIDGANSNSGAAIYSYVGAWVRSMGGSVTAGTGSLLNPLGLTGRGASGNPSSVVPVQVRTRVLYNPELKSSLFLIPGLISMILILTAVIATALSIVREKEKGTLEQLITTPLHPGEFILGKILPPFLFSIAETTLILIASRLFFGVEVRGSLIDLGILTFLFLGSCLGLGLLISTLAESQQVAFLIAIIITFLPSYILSGFVFPIRNMPPLVQLATYLVPSRYFLSGLRQVMIRGTEITCFWKDAVFLFLFGMGTIALGVHRLRKGGLG